MSISAIDTVIRSLRGSRCNNTQYIQPHTQLAEHVISHKLSREKFMGIVEAYGGRDRFTPSIITRYFHEDMILEVDEQKQKSCYMFLPDYKVTSFPEASLELFQGTKVDLSVTRFPLNNMFHHERQQILLTLEGVGYVLCMEILLPWIREPCDRYADLERIFDLGSNVGGLDIDECSEPEPETETETESDPAISYSYRFYIRGIINWSDHENRLCGK